MLDAVDGPSASPRAAAALSAWFAGVMHATELIAVGEPAPDAPMPTRSLAVGERP